MASQIVKSLHQPKTFKQTPILFTKISVSQSFKPFLQTSLQIINAYKIPKQKPKFPAPQLFATSLSSTSPSSMEVKKISVMEHDNKENIPPFSTLKKPGPNEEKGQRASVKINGSRGPLRDVTNFYRAAAQLPTSALVSGFSSSRKRKLVDDAAEQKPSSKILRREYR